MTEDTGVEPESWQAWVFCVRVSLERAWLGCGAGAVGSLGCCSLVRKEVWGEGSFQRELMCWLGRASEEQDVRLMGNQER